VSRQDQDRRARRWSVAQRLDFAANRLFWDGTLQREDIIARFGVSPAQATSDLSALRARLGEAIRYDISRRSYVPGSRFGTPPADAGRLLAELRLIAEGVMEAGDGVLANPPPTEIAGQLVRSVDPEVLRAVLWAIRDAQALLADYVSFQRPEVTRRKLSPHALVFDGFRWHMRAHDAEDGRFKDFVLSRLSAVGIDGPAVETEKNDADWARWLCLQIAPHPGLTKHQQAVVRLDYNMGQTMLELPVRAAVEFYARKRLGLVEGHENRPAKEQQIVLVGCHPMR